MKPISSPPHQACNLKPRKTRRLPWRLHHHRWANNPTLTKGHRPDGLKLVHQCRLIEIPSNLVGFFEILGFLVEMLRIFLYPFIFVIPADPRTCPENFCPKTRPPEATASVFFPGESTQLLQWCFFSLF